jgi:hypothetical protein
MNTFHPTITNTHWLNKISYFHIYLFNIFKLFICFNIFYLFSFTKYICILPWRLFIVRPILTFSIWTINIVLALQINISSHFFPAFFLLRLPLWELLFPIQHFSKNKNSKLHSYLFSISLDFVFFSQEQYDDSLKP